MLFTERMSCVTFVFNLDSKQCFLCFGPALIKSLIRNDIIIMRIKCTLSAFICGYFSTLLKRPFTFFGTTFHYFLGATV